MAKTPFSVWTPERARRRLALLVLAFAAAVGGPLAMLMKHVYDQLRMEALVQVRSDADDLVTRIDRRAQDLLATEEARKFEEFTFLNVLGNATANSLQLSPLSKFPTESRLPGLVGYFQLDPNGTFSSPLLPTDAKGADGLARYGIEQAGYIARRAKETEVLKILQANKIVSRGGPATVGEFLEQLAKTKAFAGRAGAPAAEDDLESTVGLLKNVRQKKVAAEKPQAYAPRKVQVQVQEAEGAAGPTTVRTFEGEIDAFQVAALDSGDLVLFRKVWRDKQRFVQGAVLDQAKFVDGLFRQAYEESPLVDVAALEVTSRDHRVLASFGPQGGNPRHLARQALSAPFDGIFAWTYVSHVSYGPNVAYVLSICGLLVVVLVAGVAAIYLAGKRQIALAQQQRDFVSAVSHELKTPLTSIRMYAEMLREGWATEEKKRGYYDFIFTESERLSRLIANVLQLSRLSHGNGKAQLRNVTASEAHRLATEVVKTQTLGASFTHRDLPASDGRDPTVAIDPDGLIQVLVNLVDNGIKFSRKTGQTVIETGYEVAPAGGEVRFFVRDFGPGIPRDQLRRVFQLFYRPENELTRTTKGTGIGLAVVSELVAQMGGRIDVESAPGLTEFRVILPVVAAS